MTRQSRSNAGELASRYPRHVNLDRIEIELDLMTRADAEPLLEFVQSQPERDLLFLRQDITQSPVMKTWIQEIERGSMLNLMALHEGVLVGCCAVVRDEASWSSHVGEVQVIVSEPMRGHGLGRKLIVEALALSQALGLRKLMAQMTTDQRAAIAMFESMGFRAEALLTGQVCDRYGQSHDIAMLAHRMDEQSSRAVPIGAWSPPKG